MVTIESNRTQPSLAPSYDRPAPELPLPGEEVAEAGVAHPKAGPLRAVIWFTSLIASGATIASIWGLSTLALGIIGLAGVVPAYMLSVAGITLGLAFLTLGGLTMAWARTFLFADHPDRRERAGFSGAVAGVWIAGLAGIAAGILNLTLYSGVGLGGMGVAAILFGLGLAAHSGAMHHVSRFSHQRVVDHVKGPLAVNALSVAPIRDFVVGVGAVILGILAILDVVPVLLGLVALLALGGTVAVTALTICGATVAGLEHRCSKD